MVTPSSGAGDRAPAAKVMMTHPYRWITGLKYRELCLTACPLYPPRPDMTGLFVVDNICSLAEIGCYFAGY